jgi:hypothetical protein
LEPAIPHCEPEKYVQEQVADAAVYANFLVSRSAYADTESRVASLFVSFHWLILLPIPPIRAALSICCH